MKRKSLFWFKRNRAEIILSVCSAAVIMVFIPVLMHCQNVNWSIVISLLMYVVETLAVCLIGTRARFPFSAYYFITGTICFLCVIATAVCLNLRYGITSQIAVIAFGGLLAYTISQAINAKTEERKELHRHKELRRLQSLRNRMPKLK